MGVNVWANMKNFKTLKLLIVDKLNTRIKLTFNDKNYSSTTQDVPWENPHNNEDVKPNNSSKYNR